MFSRIITAGRSRMTYMSLKKTGRARRPYMRLSAFREGRSISLTCSAAEEHGCHGNEAGAKKDQRAGFGHGGNRYRRELGN